MTRLGAGRYADAGPAVSDDVATSVHELSTVDGAAVTGVLRVPGRARSVVTLMHPRQDVTHHTLVPYLLAAGYAVWTQGSRSLNNDLNLLHEQAILDFAAGQVFLHESGFDHVVTLGHSGGGTLAAFYVEQAARTDRLGTAPSGRPVALPDATMPLPDGAIFLAPHPGQGALLQRVIDPSVTDEADPLSVDPALDPFAAANGFRDAPAPAEYGADFVARYRAAQADRVRRLDATAAAMVAEARSANRSYKAHADASQRRRALVPRLLTVHRTDADLRNVDLSIDPNARPYGSLFGRRPDLTNYGLVGFGRLSTAEAWMSTWSANTTNADFLRCAPGVTVPTLLLEFTGDQASFPSDIAAFSQALGADDLTVDAVAGTHFGRPLTPDGPSGNELASAVIEKWLGARFPA
ncbi:alpha/beta hydrolase [Cryptosporangium phraense]|uniref:Alpha/beta hydrolase n=1 Tax=Cryptosporangium phraense TaxID=2593070 RepID=A0A545AV64_9ACTN|nr:alpha/beta hydrolase [Cryptosporangium phraense]TQS45220.1 alpha/beta hydrolase [Cryptosporangium phraense]